MSVIPIHIVPGSTSVSVWVHIVKQSDGGSHTDARDATGLVTTDLTAKYCRTGGTEQTISLSALGSLNAAYSSGGFFEASEGWYRLDLPDAAVAASAGQCFVRLAGNPSTQHVSGHLLIALDFGVNMVAINSGRTDGNNATLKLKAIDVQNSSGDAALLSSGGGNGRGLTVQGAGTGLGLSIAGGANAGGAQIIGSAGGHGLNISGGGASGSTPAGDGLHVTGGAASTTSGGTAGHGFTSLGGSGAASTNGSGRGGFFQGGTITTVSGGDGLRCQSDGGVGFFALGGTSGGNSVGLGAGNAAFDITGTSVHGIRIICSGSTSDAITATIVGRHGINLAAGGNGDGLHLAGAGTGHPISDNAIVSTTFAANAINATVIADGAIDRATFAADTGLQTVRSNTCQSGSTSTTIKLDSGASSTDHTYEGDAVYLTGGTGIGQVAAIIGYVGSTKIATIAGSWLTTPDNTTTFAICKAVYGSNTIIFV